MLKRTKSANQSVLQDAIDTNNTSVTLAGPIQPDEDDYGYVSQEAAAFYNKMMEKYSKMPDEPKFNLNKKKKVSTDLNSTKERVRAALERESEEANMPHKRKRKHKDEEENNEREKYDERQKQEEPRKSKPKPAAPPPLNFNELLKLAEKKQFEPIIIEQKPKEEEKLFTKKQKKEMEREKEYRDRKEGKLPPLEKGPLNKIPKLNKDGDSKVVKLTQNSELPKKNSVDLLKKNQKSVAKVPEPTKKPSLSSQSISVNDKRLNVPSPNIKPSSSNNKSREIIDLKRKEMIKPSCKSVPPPRKLPTLDSKPKQFPPKDLQPKQFPPPDVRRKEFPPSDMKRKLITNKSNNSLFKYLSFLIILL